MLSAAFHRSCGVARVARRRRRPERLAAGVGLASLSLLGGCYGYYRPATESAPVGRSVHLVLTDSGSVVMAPQVGPSSESLSGRLEREEGGVYFLSLQSVRQRSGAETDWRGERVIVPRSLVARLEERRLSRGRTLLSTTLTAVAFVAARAAFTGPGGAGGSGRGPTGGQTPK